MTLTHVHLPEVSRRTFIGGIGAAVAAGSIGSVGFATRAAAAPPRFLGGPTPKPIPVVVPTGVPDPPFDEIHWLLPGPDGSSTPFNGIPGFGLDVDPSTITDFDGFSALAVISGVGEAKDGTPYDVEFDVRVMSGNYIAEDGTMHRGTFGFFWFDLFTPGTGVPAEQIHDYNPGILTNGLFWTMALPEDSLWITNGGTRANLRLEALPMPNTFVFANNVSVAGEIDVNVTWDATSAPVERGLGLDVPPDDPAAFKGMLADADCAGTVRSRHTGFSFTSGGLDASGFFAEMGDEMNGSFLS